MRALWVLLLASLLAIDGMSASAQATGPGGANAAVAGSKPKVRAITGFVRLERATYARQVNDTLAVLRNAKRAPEASWRLRRSTWIPAGLS